MGSNMAKKESDNSDTQELTNEDIDALLNQVEQIADEVNELIDPKTDNTPQLASADGQIEQKNIEQNIKSDNENGKNTNITESENPESENADSESSGSDNSASDIQSAEEDPKPDSDNQAQTDNKTNEQESQLSELEIGLDEDDIDSLLNQVEQITEQLNGTTENSEIEKASEPENKIADESNTENQQQTQDIQQTEIKDDSNQNDELNSTGNIPSESDTKQQLASDNSPLNDNQTAENLSANLHSSEIQNTEEQNTETQNQEEQHIEEQKSEEQNPQAHNTEETNSKEQNLAGQGSEELNSEKQNHEQLNSEQQNQEIQNSESEIDSDASQIEQAENGKPANVTSELEAEAESVADDEINRILTLGQAANKAEQTKDKTIDLNDIKMPGIIKHILIALIYFDRLFYWIPRSKKNILGLLGVSTLIFALGLWTFIIFFYKQ